MDIRQVLTINTHTHLNHGAAGESAAEQSPAYSAKLDWLRNNALRLFGDKLKRNNAPYPMVRGIVLRLIYGMVISSQKQVHKSGILNLQ